MKMAAATAEARTTAMVATALVMIAHVALAIAHFVVDAHKGRDVACFDILGAFLCRL